MDDRSCSSLRYLEKRLQLLDTPDGAPGGITRAYVPMEEQVQCMRPTFKSAAISPVRGTVPSPERSAPWFVLPEWWLSGIDFDPNRNPAR
jgi:hypothetical protein